MCIRDSKYDDMLMLIHAWMHATTQRFYHALQYLLIFWKAQEGYGIDVPKVNPTTKAPDPKEKVSSMIFMPIF